MENENNNQFGELNGFDFVSNENTGYTVTPNGSYFENGNTEEEKEAQSVSEEQCPQPEEETPVAPVAPAAPVPEQEYRAYESGFYAYKPPKPKKEKKRYGIGLVILSGVIAAVIGAVSAISVLVPLYLKETQESETYTEYAQNQVNITVEETAENMVEAVAEKVSPSVVGIRTTMSVMSFFGRISEATGSGSGVVYSSDGYIITNYHVISDALESSDSKVEVFLDNTEANGYKASVVGYNIAADLAVIKIDAKGLTPVEFGDSSVLKVGQYVITIGSPGGLEFMDSVTYGVISGLDRVVSSDSSVKLIQTDAAINPGNSGGALVNSTGLLVGINSSKIVSEEYEGMGFAIPSNTVKTICEDIIARENAPEPYIGISISEIYTADVLEYYGYPNGAVILSVADGSPADDAGIAKGDIITKYNDTKISEYNILENEISNSRPGDKVTIEFYRSGRLYTTELTVGSNNAVD